MSQAFAVIACRGEQMRVAGEQAIGLPPGTVFDLFSDLERSGEYSRPVIERRKLTDGPIGVGTKYHAVDQWPGRRVSFTVEITECEKPSLLVARWTDPMEGGWRARFTPDGGGTRLWFEATMRPRGMLRFVSPVLRPWARRQTRSFLEAFKSWAEAQQG